MTINNQIKQIVDRLLAHWREEIDTELDDQEFEMLRDGMFDKLDEYTVTLRKKEKKVAKKLSACKRKATFDALIKRDGLCCHYCGDKLTREEDITHRPHPWLRGRTEIGNVIRWFDPIIIDFETEDAVIEFPPEVKLPSIDHKLPPKQGGSHEIDNLVLSCFPCNIKKGSKSYKEFKESMRR